MIYFFQTSILKMQHFLFLKNLLIHVVLFHLFPLFPKQNQHSEQNAPYSIVAQDLCYR